MSHSAAACFGPVDYDLSPRDSVYGGQDEDAKMYTVGAVRTKKGRKFVPFGRFVAYGCL
jgi:hypothetical protein